MKDRLDTNSDSGGKRDSDGRELPFQSGADIVHNDPIFSHSDHNTSLHVCVNSNAIWNGRYQGMKTKPDVALLVRSKAEGSSRGSLEVCRGF